MSRSIVIVILVIILIAIPILMRKLSWKKMINALNDVDYNRYYDIIDSFSCKMTFSAFDRENMRLSGFIAQNRKDDVENQIKMMMNISASMNTISLKKFLLKEKQIVWLL